MDTKLDCEIVRDLLPSYADGLTSAATNTAVETHLAGCAGCAEALRRMKEPEHTENPRSSEVDYLLKVRSRARRASALWAAGAALIVLVLLLIRIFAFGTQAGPASADYSVSVSGGTVDVSGSLKGSGQGVSRLVFRQDGGVVTAGLYTAPKAFFNTCKFSGRYQASEKVTEVRFGGLVVWENGAEISPLAARLYAAKNPYVGDMSANGKIAEILGVAGQFGGYKNELQTSAEPYGWKLILGAPVAAGDEASARSAMEADSFAMLAAIENLGYVTWEYRTESGVQEYKVTAEDASSFAGRDIKLCAGTASDLQALIKNLSLMLCGAA